jgi:hypothetical protein
MEIGIDLGYGCGQVLEFCAVFLKEGAATDAFGRESGTA